MNRLVGRGGFSLLEVLISAMLLGVVAMGVSATARVMAKVQVQSTSTFQIGLVSRTFVAHLQDSTAWNNTLNDSKNTSLACLRNRTSCQGQSGSLRVNDAGSPYKQANGYDPLASPGSGFTPSGALCSTFNSTTNGGNDQCPFRLNITWSPICLDAACIGPQVEIKGTWAHNPKSSGRSIAFNHANYDFKVIKASNGVPPGMNIWVQNVPGTYVFQVPKGVYHLSVETWGGGGGGCSFEGGAGGGGGYAQCFVPVLPDQTYTVVVGVGGRPSRNGYQTTPRVNCSSSDGGNSSFSGNGLSCYATGGKAGEAGGGDGGEGSKTAQIFMSGGHGEDLTDNNGQYMAAGGGAAPRGGPGGAIGGGGQPPHYFDGKAPGGGGAAENWGKQHQRAGHGAPGAVHVRW